LALDRSDPKALIVATAIIECATAGERDACRFVAPFATKAVWE
jgi:hypothetical protein